MTEAIKPGYYIQLVEEGRPNDFFMVATIEPFLYEADCKSIEFANSVASNAATSGWKNITNMEPDDRPRRLYQVHFGMQNGMEYQFKIPAGTNRFGVDEDKDAAWITAVQSPWFCPNELYEMWLVHNYYPSINARNNTAIALQPWIRFTGWKYDIELITHAGIMRRLNEGSLPFRKIVLGGVKPG